MTYVAEALTWAGSVPEICVFVAVPAGTRSEPAFELPDGLLQAVRQYRLEDEGGVLRGLDVYEYDVLLSQLPKELDNALVQLLTQACIGQCVVAWLGFEGSFDFAHVLTEDVACLVYGIRTGAGDVFLALEEARLKSPEWRDTIRRVRADLEVSK